MRRPAVVVTSQRVLDAVPSVVQVVPLTSVLRGFGSEVSIEPNEGSDLGGPSVAQCQHVRSVSVARIDQVRGNVGTVALAQIRGVLGVILDIPA